MCVNKKKTFWWVENLTNMIWWIFLERNRKKKKKKETLSVGIPSCANHTVRHQKHNFTSRLDKKLKRAPQKQNNWKKKKKKRNTNTLSLYRMKKCTNLKMSKRQQTACSSSTGPKKYWQPVSVNELLVCSTVLPYTSTACTTKIKESKQPQDVRIWRLWTRTAQIAFPNANCTQISSDASYLLCVAM